MIQDEYTDRDDLSYSQKYYRRNKKKASERTREGLIKRKYTNSSLYLCTRIRNRAKEKGLDFNLEPEDFIIPKTCPITGIELFFSDKTTENTPSVDRINNAKGYVKGNVAIISWRANKAKSNLSYDEIKKLWEYVSETH